MLDVLTSGVRRAGLILVPLTAVTAVSLSAAPAASAGTLAATPKASAASAFAGPTAVVGPLFAAPAVTATSVCGSGYTVLKRTPMGANGEIGTLVLLRNNASYCAVALKRARVGTPTFFGVQIRMDTFNGRGSFRTGVARKDEGRFSYYAGPVRIPRSELQSCVRYSGYTSSYAIQGPPYGACSR